MPVHRLQVGGVSLHVVDEGNGPAVLLLHGFPDSSHLWRHQIPALTSAGFRAIVPDLRGFGNSDRPQETEAYALPLILQDLIGILDHLNIERAHVVGHDWGAAAGWVLAALHPERVNRLVALSVGHPVAFTKAGLDQQEKSWYMLLFQFRGIDEELLTRQEWKIFRYLARHNP